MGRVREVFTVEEDRLVERGEPYPDPEREGHIARQLHNLNKAISELRELNERLLISARPVMREDDTPEDANKKTEAFEDATPLAVELRDRIIDLNGAIDTLKINVARIEL